MLYSFLQQSKNVNVLCCLAETVCLLQRRIIFDILPFLPYLAVFLGEFTELNYHNVPLFYYSAQQNILFRKFSSKFGGLYSPIWMQVFPMCTRKLQFYRLYCVIMKNSLFMRNFFLSLVLKTNVIHDFVITREPSCLESGKPRAVWVNPLLMQSGQFNLLHYLNYINLFKNFFSHYDIAVRC